MSDVIPFFSAREINSVADYEPLRNTRTYIQLQYAAFMEGKDKDEAHRELMTVCGYKKYPKFLMHLQDFNDLKRNVPFSYLDYIGCKRHVLEFTWELDQEEYKKALQVARYPRYGIIRYMAGVYSSFPLPEDITEEEAIEYILEKQKEIKEKKHMSRVLSMAISYRGIKTIFISPDQQISVQYYPPYLKFGKKFLVVEKEDGSDEGTSRV